MHVSSLSYLTESLLKQFKPSLFGKTYFVYEIYEDLQKSHHGSYCVIITYYPRIGHLGGCQFDIMVMIQSEYFCAWITIHGYGYFKI